MWRSASSTVISLSGCRVIQTSNLADTVSYTIRNLLAAMRRLGGLYEKPYQELVSDSITFPEFSIRPCVAGMRFWPCECSERNILFRAPVAVEWVPDALSVEGSSPSSSLLASSLPGYVFAFGRSTTYSSGFWSYRSTEVACYFGGSVVGCRVRAH